MFHRKDAVYLAVAGLLMSSGLVKAGTKLSLDPTVMTADDAAALPPMRRPIDGRARQGGRRQDPRRSQKINVYGWSESGYTFNNRHHGGEPAPGIIPGPFNHEVGNHYMLNQVDLRVERQVDSSKLDVGGMIEVMYGTDASLIHSTGLSYGGADPSSNGGYVTHVKYRANPGFDIPQAYVDVNVPVGNGLKFRVGKFVTLLGYETIDPRGNPFYSHSYIFGALPFTQTGVLGMYQLNDQWAFTAGITRGWDQALEDNGPAGGTGAIDGLGQVSWTPNKQLTALLNWNVGPQNFGDTSHYRTVIDPNVIYQVTDAFKVGVEAIYIYDGGLNGNGATIVPPTLTHAYGDVWGADVYLGYTLNDYVTLNSRLEKYHTSAESTPEARSLASAGAVR